MTRKIAVKIKPIHYKSSAAVIWCFDARFSGVLNSLVSRDCLEFPDIIKVAGGVKGIASPESKMEKNFLLDQMEKSFKLHGPKTIYLMAHAGCGAYGKSFNNSKAEQEFYEKELQKAEDIVSEFLKKKNLEAQIVKCYADFGGVFTS